MSAGVCEDELQAELPTLLNALHAGDAIAVCISHQVDARGDCKLAVEVIRPGDPPASETPPDQTWEYRWP